MLFLMIIFILIRVTAIKSNAGTAIFHNKHSKDCWNNDDIVKLRARKSFERLIPSRVNPDEIDSKYIKDMLHYFHRTQYAMDNEAQPHTLRLLKEAVCDTIGAHLRSEILPAVRFAFYAGYVSYRDTREIHDFYEDIKAYLNTQGLGWKKPKRAAQNWSNLTVTKILIGASTFFDPCTCLIIRRDANDCIHLPVPKHDDDREPSAIVLPFKYGGLISLTSPNSNNALLKYYTTASRCILSSSPRKCRHADFVSFNSALWHWMKRDVAPRLVDEKLYVAYGGILRIAASVQSYGKGLSRRNLFEYQDSGVTKWHPWQALSQSYININADWTPQVYIGLVIMTAVTIYLLQICYSFILGDSNGCQCIGHTGFFSNDATDARMETSAPVYPHQSAIYYSDQKRNKQSNCKSKTASLGSIRTHKVYDLNENTEKLMAVIMSSDDESPRESTTSRSSDEENRLDLGSKARSPPRLETSISQLTIDRKGRQGFAGSGLTQMILDKRRNPQNPSEYQSQWSSETSSTSRSGSGSSSSSKSHRSGSSHDLAWAKRVISKHSLSATKLPSTHVDPEPHTARESSHR